MNKIKKYIFIIILICLFFVTGCKQQRNVDIKERLDKVWNIKLPNEMVELYNCYQPTFTGRAFQYAVLSCMDNTIKELNSMFEFKQKDSESVDSLESFFEMMNNDKKYKIDDEYIFDLSKNYTYYVIENSVWLVMDVNSKELVICIFGY